jgi:hypothetical protein
MMTVELGEGFPEEFSAYLTYARKLGFEEAPDYDYLRGLMNKVLQKLNEQDDGVYDFMLIGDKGKRSGGGTSATVGNTLSMPAKNVNSGTGNNVLVGSILHKQHFKSDLIFIPNFYTMFTRHDK